MRALFVGETCTISQTFTKGFDNITVSRYEEAGRSFVNALQAEQIDVDFLPIHEAHRSFPDSLEELLKYDCVVFSDIGSNSFLLPPQSHWHAVRMPNRLNLVKEYVAAGGSFLMCGGYLSFTGFDGRARYGMTAIADILPVNLLSHDDRVECCEGVFPKIEMSEHPILRNISTKWPDFLGYNKLQLKENADLILSVQDKDVFLAVGDYKNGRTAAWATDIVPHWATPEFINWKDYGPFFANILRWLSREI